MAERLIKCCEASADREAGVVFRIENTKENHPGCVSFGGFATFHLLHEFPGHIPSLPYQFQRFLGGSRS